MVNPTLTMSFLKDKYINKVTKCLNEAGVAMGEEFSTNGKFTTAINNYLSNNYAKEGEPLIDKDIRSYLITTANIYPSELYNSKERVMHLIEIFARSK